MIKPCKKILLLTFVNFDCEGCHKEFEEKDLQIHRINRKGSYEDFRNLKVLCRECHKLLHSNEFRNCQGK
jgi:uncharacterized CHY-type Zn-finger protein